MVICLNLRLYWANQFVTILKKITPNWILLFYEAPDFQSRAIDIAPHLVS